MNPNPPALPVAVPAPPRPGAPVPIETIDVTDLNAALTVPAVAPELVVRCPAGTRFRDAARRLAHEIRLATGTLSTVRLAVVPAAELVETVAPPNTDVNTAVALAVAAGCTSPDDLSNTDAIGLCWYAVTGCQACATVASGLLARYAPDF